MAYRLAVDRQIDFRRLAVFGETSVTRRQSDSRSARRRTTEVDLTIDR